jgi:hypothetical protein
LTDEAPRRGTWHEPDGAKVEPAQARAEWAAAARPALLEIAGQYGRYVTYKELGARLQQDTSIHTNQRTDSWISKVLQSVADECAANGEPLLTSFCVHANETVGAAYAATVRDKYGVEPEDVDLQAAEERLKAHHYFGAAGLPADGGRPQLPPGIAARRARAAAAAPRVPRPMCPNCFIEMPITGICGMCTDA